MKNNVPNCTRKQSPAHRLKQQSALYSVQCTGHVTCQPDKIVLAALQRYRSDLIDMD